MFMKVAIVHSYYKSGQASGENLVVDNQFLMLQGKGYEVKLFAKYTEFEEMKWFYSLKCGFRVITGFGSNFSRDMRLYDPDIILVHNLFPNLSTRWLTKLKCKKIFFVHNFRPWCSNGFMLRKLSPCSKCLSNPFWGTYYKCSNGNRAKSFIQSLSQLRAVDLLRQQDHGAKIVAVSEYAARTISSIESKLNVISISNFVLNPSISTEVVQHAPMDQVKFVWNGRISPEKGLRQLLEIWPDEFVIDIIGSGPEEKELLHKFEDKSNINFLGYKSNKELLGKLTGYSGLVNSSIWPEFGPMTVLESLAAGLPVIAPNSLSLSDQILQQKAGTIYDFKNKESLFLAISDIINPPPGVDYAENARELYSDIFSFETWHSKIMGLF